MKRRGRKRKPLMTANRKATNTRSLFPVRHRTPKADVLYDSGGGGTVYDPPPKERRRNAADNFEDCKVAY